MSDGLDQLRLVLGPQQSRAPLALPPMPVRPRRTTGVPAPAPKKKDRSFWQNVASLFTEGLRASANLGPGLIHLGGVAFDEATGRFRQGFDAARALKDIADGGGISDETRRTALIQMDPGLRMQKYAPGTFMVGQSLTNTGSRLIHPTQYARAFNEGKLTPVLLEDVGNAMLVAGGLGKALGASAASARAAAEASAAAGAADAVSLASKASRLEKAASIAMRAEKLGGEVANVPFKPYVNKYTASALRTVGRAGGRGLLTAFENLASKDSTLGEMARNIRATNASRLTEEGRAGYGLLRTGWARGQRAYDRVWKVAAENAQKGGFNSAEEGAAFALINNVGKGDYQLTQMGRALGMTPEAVRELHAQRLLPEQGFTPEVRDLVHAYESGSLPADVRARIDSHIYEIRKMADEVQKTTLAGSGRLAGGLDPQQLGVDAVDRNVVLNLRQAGMADAQIEALVQRKQRLGSWDQVLEEVRRESQAQQPLTLRGSTSQQLSGPTGRPAGLAVRGAGERLANSRLRIAKPGRIEFADNAVDARRIADFEAEHATSVADHINALQQEQAQYADYIAALDRELAAIDNMTPEQLQEAVQAERQRVINAAQTLRSDIEYQFFTVVEIVPEKNWISSLPQRVIRGRDVRGRPIFKWGFKRGDRFVPAGAEWDFLERLSEKDIAYLRRKSSPIGQLPDNLFDQYQANRSQAALPDHADQLSIMRELIEMSRKHDELGQFIRARPMHMARLLDRASMQYLSEVYSGDLRELFIGKGGAEALRAVMRDATEREMSGNGLFSASSYYAETIPKLQAQYDELLTRAEQLDAHASNLEQGGAPRSPTSLSPVRRSATASNVANGQTRIPRLPIADAVDPMTPPFAAAANGPASAGVTLLDQALADITSYPSRWRPLMRQMNLAREAGLPVSSLPRDLAAAGYDPIYLPGGESQLFKSRWQKSPQDVLNVGSAGLRGMSSERLRMNAELQPYSWRTYAEQLSSRARTTVLNDALMTFVQSGGIKKVADVLDGTELADLRAQATQEAIASNPALFRQTGNQFTMETGSPNARQAAVIQEILGDRIVKRLADKGYEVFQGDAVAPKAGDFNPGAAVDTTKVLADSLVLPIGVRARFQLRTIPKGVNAVLEGLRYTNRKWKGAVLPFSLRWQIGDALGGFFQGAVGGGILPDEMIAKMADLKNGRLSQDALDATVNHPNFVDTGLTRDMADYRMAAQSRPPRTVIGKLQRKSFALNETINRFNRQAYLLAKLERLLKEKGLSIDDVERTKAWNDPEVQRAINEAVDDSNKVMGTFDDLTPFEQRYLREIMPFYAWTRHITKLTMRTAIDNPARVMWTLRLGTMVTDPEERPDWLLGSIKLPDALVPDFIAKGDALLPTNFMNPFNDALNNPAYTPSGIARSLSPGIRIPMAGIFGLEANPGDNATPFRMITRPYGETRNPLRDAVYTGLQSFPATREAMNLAPQVDVAGIDLGPVVRYHSGRKMVDAYGNPIGPYANMGPLAARATIPLRLAGIPLPTSAADAQAIVRSRQKAATVRRRKRKKVRLG